MRYCCDVEPGCAFFVGVLTAVVAGAVSRRSRRDRVLRRPALGFIGPRKFVHAIRIAYQDQPIRLDENSHRRDARSGGRLEQIRIEARAARIEVHQHVADRHPHIVRHGIFRDRVNHRLRPVILFHLIEFHHRGDGVHVQPMPVTVAAVIAMAGADGSNLGRRRCAARMCGQGSRTCAASRDVRSARSSARSRRRRRRNVRAGKSWHAVIAAKFAATETARPAAVKSAGSTGAAESAAGPARTENSDQPRVILRPRHSVCAENQIRSGRAVEPCVAADAENSGDVVAGRRFVRAIEAQRAIRAGDGRGIARADEESTARRFVAAGIGARIA